MLLAAALTAALGAVGLAKIEALDLEEMVSRADNAVYGEIIAKHAFKFDHPIDGPDLYFTTMTVEGRSLADGSKITVDVTYHGGRISEDDVQWNSEAPTEQETAIGNRVVVFYRWFDNMGGDLSANALEASHGGLFRTVSGPNGSVVMGRGKGYAVEKNTSLSDLDIAVTELRSARDKK